MDGTSSSEAYDRIIDYNPHMAPPEDSHLLIMPKKLDNPVLGSQNHRNMHAEMKINQKLGINVLGQKGELGRVFREKKREDFQAAREVSKSDFEIMLEKRRKAQDDQEKSKTEEQETSEFLKIRNRLVKSDDGN